jgi:hypothetical protein
MNLTDRFVIALLATFFLLVLWIERKKSMLPSHVKPTPAGVWLLQRTNVPTCRPQGAMLEQVTYSETWRDCE